MGRILPGTDVDGDEFVSRAAAALYYLSWNFTSVKVFPPVTFCSNAALCSPCTTNTNIRWCRDVVDGSDTAQLARWASPGDQRAGTGIQRSAARRVDLQSGVAINKRSPAPTDRPAINVAARQPPARPPVRSVGPTFARAILYHAAPPRAPVPREPADCLPWRLQTCGDSPLPLLASYDRQTRDIPWTPPTVAALLYSLPNGFVYGFIIHTRLSLEVFSAAEL